MLDEYSDDFGTNFSNEIPEHQQRQLKGNPLPYYNPQPAQPYNEPPAAPPPPRPAPQQRQQQVPPQGYYQPQAAWGSFPPPPPPPIPPGRPNRLDQIFGEESKDLSQVLKAEERAGCLRNVFFTLISILIIAGSFWASFVLGQRIFMPQHKIDQANLPEFLLKQTKTTLKTTIKKAENSTKLLDLGSDLVKDLTMTPTPKNVVPSEVKSVEKLYVAPENLNPEPLQTEPTPKKIQPVTPKKIKKTTSQPKAAAASGLYFRVIAGTYDTEQMARDAAHNLKADGFPCYLYKTGDKYRLQAGAFKNRSAAAKFCNDLKQYGYNSAITTN